VFGLSSPAEAGAITHLTKTLIFYQKPTVLSRALIVGGIGYRQTLAVSDTANTLKLKNKDKNSKIKLWSIIDIQ